MERTLVILKPDAVQRGLVGRILSRFEAKGLKIVALKMKQLDRALAGRLYAPHKHRDFFKPLVRFVTSGPAVLLVLEGKGAVAVVRKMAGATFGSAAEPGTIRGDFGVSNRLNLIHGSDSPEGAEREIALFFTARELIDWQPAALPWLYDFSGGDVV